MNKAPFLALAPMAGITDWPMRLLCREQGCNYTTTEMISAQGYLAAPDASRVYQGLLAVSPDEPKPVVQIFGCRPELMGQAAARLADTGAFSGVDINMGCPAHKVVGSGGGSALLKDLPLCGRIIAAVRAATSLPVSVKMRLGWDASSLCAEELAHIAQEEGADLLTVHGRTREQQYAGQADWAAIARVKAGVRIPVLANGDVNSPETALACLRETGCDGVAIGRGALGNPFLFAQIAAALRGEACPPPTAEEMTRTAIRHADMMRAWKGEKIALLEMRKHLCWYIHSRRGAARLRTQIVAAATLDEACELLLRFAAQPQEESEIPG
ncbi:MAG: tRNA dihydrouridine synthase DusB [Clostridia bacterium]|nr:tRNA dihydrouridine synthase DusB [Clostridia bacterium]